MQCNRLIFRGMYNTVMVRLLKVFYWYKTFEKCVEIDNVFAFVNHITNLANNGYICYRFFDAQN